MGYGKPNFMVAADIITGYRDPETKGKNLLGYPNPAKQILHLSIPPTSSRSFRYHVMDIAGRNLLSGNLRALAGSASIPINRLAPGTYIIVLYGEPEVFNTIFTKE